MKRVGKTLKRFWTLYLMFLPGAVYLFINCYIPMFGIQIAFRTYNARDGIYGSPWCGMEDFEFLFRTNDAWIMTRNTLLYNFVFIVLGTVLAIAVAIILNEVKSKGAKQLYQTIILIPYLISMVIVGYLAFAFLSTSNGFINHGILEPLFGENAAIDWYNEPKYWPVFLIFIYVWKGTGYSSIIYLGSITGISDEYYEAAVIDGATKWQQIVHITLPFLKPMAVVLTIMRVGSMFSSNFDLFYQVPMNSGQLYSVTNTIDVFVYNTLKESNNVGLSSAVSFVQSVAGLVLVLVTNQIIRWIDRDLAMF